MTRAAPALLLLAALVVAGLPLAAEAQFGSGISIPTQKDLVVGNVNFTTWIMRDAASVSYRQDPTNPLGGIFNATLTAGSTGIIYVKSTVQDNTSTQVRVVITPVPDVLRVSPGNATNATLARPCTTSGLTILCNLNASAPSGDSALQFYAGIGTPPGPIALNVSIEVYATESGVPVFQARGAVRHDAAVQSPVPPYAERRTTGGVGVYLWLQSGVLGLTGGGCQAGVNAAHEANVSRGFPSVVCVVGIPTDDGQYRVSVNGTGPSWVTFSPSTWQSRPFNRTSGGIDVPIGSLLMQTAGEAPVGDAQLSVNYTVERLANDTWVPVGGDSIPVAFSVVRGPVVPGQAPGRVNWVAQAPILLATIGGLGYMVYRNRGPKLEPRSQALRDLSKRGKRGDGGEGTAQAVAVQKQEAAEAATDKKRLILEAKKEDIVKSIRIAEGRKQLGEITDHVFAGIKERKERQLEQVEKELAELDE